MNETEVREMFETLTRNPVPSRYEPEAVRSTSRRHRTTQLAAVVGCTAIAITIGVLAVDRNDPNRPLPLLIDPTTLTPVVPWHEITPGPMPSPGLAVPLEGKPIAVSLTLPAYQRQSAPDSARYGFVVRLSNSGGEPVPLDPCPYYRVQFVKDVETGYLNCNEAPSAIPARGHVDFAMEAPAHDAEILAREGGKGFKLLWQLGAEGAEGATAEGTAVLADGAAATPTRHPACSGDSIAVHSGGLDGAAGTTVLSLTVTSTAEPCTLPTFPDVRFLHNGSVVPVPTRLQLNPPTRAVVLSKAAPATFMLFWANWCAPEIEVEDVAVTIGNKRFQASGFGKSPICQVNGGQRGGEDLNIRGPITIGFYMPRTENR